MEHNKEWAFFASKTGLIFCFYLLFIPQYLQGQVCNCKEYIYLNEPEISTVVKFEIDSNQILLNEVLGVNGGTVPNQHWYPGTGTSELPYPHGLAVDLNGNLFIGSDFAAGTPIRKLDCEGNIFPVDGTTITNPYILTNIFSIRNTLYTTRSGGPASFDLCTGTELGTMCLNDNAGAQLPAIHNTARDNVNWGLSYNSNLEMVYATGQGVARQGVWAFTRTELENGIQGGACIDPLIWRSTTVDLSGLSVGDAFLPNNIRDFNGVVSDNDGNIYVAGWLAQGGNPGFVLKYNSAGQFQAAAPLDPAFVTTRGVIWSEDTDRIYVSNQTDTPGIDCISVFDATTLAYLGTGAPNPNLPDNNAAKALSIIKECCPTPATQTIDQTYCDVNINDQIFLNELFPCEGTICGAAWTPMNITGMTYDPCDQSITITAAEACGTFSKVGSNAQCGAFNLTYNLDVLTSPDVSVTGAGTICPDNPTLDLTASSTTAGVTYQWQISDTDCNGTWSDIGGATNATYTVTGITADTDYRVLTTLSGTCSSGACVDTSACVMVEYRNVCEEVSICSCTDYLYLAEPVNGNIYKFILDGNIPLNQVGSPWYGGSEFPNPHGVATDLNGFLYIGEVDVSTSPDADNTNIRRVTCDGDVISDTEFAIDDFANNVQSIGNTLYVTGGSALGIRAYNLCTGDLIGTACPTIISWELDYNRFTKTFTWGGQGNVGIFTFSAQELEDAVANGTCFGAPVIPPAPPGEDAYAVGDNFIILTPLFNDFPVTGGNLCGLWGVTTDNDGNIYALHSCGGGEYTKVVKWDSNGEFLAESAVGTLANGDGWAGGLGIRYHAGTNRLYQSNWPADADCVSSWDTDLSTYTQAVPPSGLTGFGVGKAINIITECCPSPLTQTIDQVYCEAAQGEKLFLNEIFPCDGIICSAPWTPDASNTGMTYDSCDQSITITAAEACGTFTKVGSNAQCGAFNLTYNLDILTNTAPVISGVSPTCATNNDPTALSIDTPSSGSGLTYTWQSSTTDCNTGWMDITGAPTDGTAYDPPVLSQETYFRVITQANGTCSSGMCADTSNCVTLTPETGCVQPCALTDAGETLETCNDNGTNTDPSDDYITFSLNPIGSNLGASYSVTADNSATVTLAAGGAATGISYGSATTFRLQDGSADGATNFTITVTDGDDAACTITVMAMQNSCSGACVLSITENTPSACQNNGTIQDSSDDYFTLTVNATAMGGNTQYQAVLNANPDGTGGTVLGTATYGTALTLGDGANGATGTFAADGSSIYNITLRDAIDNTCHEELTTTLVADCATPCPTINNSTTSQTICEGQTLTTLSVSTDATSPDQIEFVYFSNQQLGDAMYTSGTSLGLVSPNAGSASISNVGFPGVGTYYVYAILSPTPADANCRPTQEIIVTVQPNPVANLAVSDTIICTGTDALIWLYNSEIGVNYQLRNNADDSPIGSFVAGTGTAISFVVNGLTPAGTYAYNVLATTAGTACSQELTDLAEITVQNCDFTIFDPACDIPPCHFTSSDIYLGIDVNGEAGAGNTDIDNGLGFPNNIRPEVQIRIPVTLYNNTGQTAYLSVWIDWNGDSDFEDAGEQIASETYSSVAPNTGSFQVSVSTTVPANAIQVQNIGVRARLSTDDSIIFSPCGVLQCAADGEVEDYLIQVECPPEGCVPVEITINRN